MKMPNPALFPAGFVTRHSTNDFRELVSLAPPWGRLYRKIRPGPCAGWGSLANTAHLQAGEQCLSAGIAISGQTPERCWTFVLPLGGSTRGRVQGVPVAGDELCVIPEDKDFHWWSNDPLRWLSVSVCAARLKAHAQLSRNDAFWTQALQGRVALGAGGGIRLARRWRKLNSLIMNRPDLLNDAGRASRIERAFLEGMTRFVKADAAPRRLTQRTRIARAAQAYLHTRCHRPVSVEELCAAVGVPARTLHLAFHEAYGMPPGHYMKLHRLNEAHQALLQGGATATVSQIAMDCGFLHLGRFAVDYHALFGETPSETAAGRKSRKAA
ncbi:MAG: AraC family transcriptional regulator [Thiogranum sp.]|nr:AraC family transcriptional regulator [Thiogranum sp.]